MKSIAERLSTSQFEADQLQTIAKELQTDMQAFITKFKPLFESRNSKGKKLSYEAWQIMFIVHKLADLEDRMCNIEKLLMRKN